MRRQVARCIYESPAGSPCTVQERQVRTGARSCFQRFLVFSTMVRVLKLNVLFSQGSRPNLAEDNLISIIGNIPLLEKSSGEKPSHPRCELNATYVMFAKTGSMVSITISATRVIPSRSREKAAPSALPSLVPMRGGGGGGGRDRYKERCCLSVARATQHRTPLRLHRISPHRFNRRGGGYSARAETYGHISSPLPLHRYVVPWGRGEGGLATKKESKALS